MYCRQPRLIWILTPFLRRDEISLKHVFKKFVMVKQFRCLQVAGLSIMVFTVAVSTGRNILWKLFKLLLLALEDQGCLPFVDFLLKIMLDTQQGCQTFFFGELTGEYIVGS